MKSTNELKISVVLLAYNEAATIEHCLELLQAQTVKPYEIIVVDNNSTDESAAIARRFAAVRVIHEPVQGIIAARNRGFGEAKGDIIARVDPDSRPAPSWIAEIERVFTKHPKVAGVTGALYYYDMPSPKTGQRLEWTIRSAVRQAIPRFEYLSGANMALRREVWQRIRAELCTDEELYEDIDIALHLARHKLPIFYDERLVVGTTARRVDDPFPAFRNYLARYTRTYRSHGFGPIASRLPAAIYVASYPSLKLLRRFARRR